MTKEKNPLKFYVYAYLRSKDSATAKAGTPYYIGKGNGRRAYKDHGRIRKPNDRNNIIFIQTGLSESDAFRLENEMVLIYGRVDNNTGILRNLTNGGEGSSGFKHSEETKEFLSIHQKSLNWCGEKNPFYGGKFSEEVLERLRQRTGENNPMFGRNHSEESKDLMSTNRFGVTQKQVQCPHCGQVGGNSSMKKWHFNNCRNKENQIKKLDKLTDKSYNYKNWLCVDPNGIEYHITNLAAFCEFHNLSYQRMIKISKHGFRVIPENSWKCTQVRD